MTTLRRFLPLLFLLFITFLPIAPGFLSGKTIGAFDQIRAMSPEATTEPDQAWDVLQADSVLQFYPWRMLVFDAWHKRQLPFWNRHQLAGTPLMANSQSGALYPPHIFVGLTGIPTPLAINFLAWLHLFWAGAGLYLLVRRLGGNGAGGLFAGAAFALSPFMLAWTPLPSVISTCAWIPWSLYCVLDLFASPELRDRMRRAGALGLCVAMMLLAGHLQFAAYGLIATSLAAAWLSIFPAATPSSMAPEKGRRIACLALAGSGLLIGFLLAAPQVLPVLEFGKTSHRQSIATEAGYESYAASALKPFELCVLGGPSLVGTPLGVAKVGDTKLPEFWPLFFKRGANFAESAIGPGLAVMSFFVLSFFCRELRPRLILLWLVAAVGLLLAVGSPLAKAMYFWAPGWSSTGSPGRAEVLFVLGTCAAAGCAFGQLDFSKLRGLLKWSPALIGFGILAIGILLAQSIPESPYDPKGNFAPILARSTTQMALMVEFAVAASVSMAIFLLSAGPKYISISASLCIAGFMTMVFRVIPFGQPPQTGVSNVFRMYRFAVVNDEWEIVVRPKAIKPPNWLTMEKQNDIGGYDSLIDKETVAWLKRINGQDSAPPANGNMMFIKSTANPDMLMDAGVLFLYSQRALPQFQKYEVHGSGAAHVYYLPTKGRITGPNEYNSIRDDGYDHQSITAYGPGLVTVKDRFLPGWSATLDLEPAPIVPGLWRSVQVPDRAHALTFHYIPPGWQLGIKLGGVGLALFLAFALFPQRKSLRILQNSPETDVK